MKSKIIFGLATLAALTLPAMAEDGRFRDRDDHARGYVVQQYVAPSYLYATPVYDHDNVYVGRVDRDDVYRREAREAQERRERLEHERFEHDRGWR